MILELALTAFLVMLNGYFVASEFALVRMRASSVNKMVNEEKFASKTLEDIMENLDDYLAVTQIGITISSLALGGIGEHAVSKLLRFLLPNEWSAIIPAAALFGASFLVITYLHVVFGELAPKTIAIQRANKFSRFTAKPMKFFYYLFLPGIIIFNGSSNRFTRMIGIEPASETEEILSEEEIINILEDSTRKDEIDKDEMEMIEGVFQLDDKIASEIMTPKNEVVSFNPDDKIGKMKTTVRDETYQRYPVTENNDIIGFIDVRQITSNETDDNLTAGDMVKEIPIIEGEMPVDDIIRTIQKENREILAVKNQDGEFIGLVTSEDVVEEIIGDIKSYFEQYRQVNSH